MKHNSLIFTVTWLPYRHIAICTSHTYYLSPFGVFASHSLQPDTPPPALLPIGSRYFRSYTFPV